MDLKGAYEAAVEALGQKDEAAAERALADVIAASARDLKAAQCLAIAACLPGWSMERRAQFASELLDRWDDFSVVETLASEFEAFVDFRFLNNAPPTDAMSLRLLELAAMHFERASGADKGVAALGLYSVARLSGRAADGLCERAARTSIELEPESANAWYRYGLFLKTRGRFAEGVTANQRAAELAGTNDDATLWNLGICATGARQGALALDLWRQKLGAKLELGENGLPTGTWHHVKVRLAARPLATRTSSDDSPGDEETVWVERLSPCHGRVLNPTAGELDADFGDLVLFDGSPIVTQQIQGRAVPVFPHLVTLERGGWQIFRFVALGLSADRVKTINEQLGRSAVLYSHSDSVVFLCRACADAGKVGDCGHPRENADKPTHGKLCVAPRASLTDVDASLAVALRRLGVTWASPTLATRLGDHRRAQREQTSLDRLKA